METLQLGSSVKLKMSDERGIIVGCATYLELPPDYLIRYKAAGGRQVEQWWRPEAFELLD